ncbi:MAG: hypothetical protein ABI679_14210 [Gemmatimonadota bacterium]
MRIKRLFVAIGLAGCLTSGSGPDRASPQQYRVLFIGNSLTYFNNLPGTLSQLASSAGDSLVAISVARPNFAVIDHANGQSNAVEVIRSGHWDFVILQQGPTSEAIGRDTLVLATLKLDPDIRAAGGRSAQMMTWPASDRPQDFDAVLLSSQKAANAVAGLLLPVGEAWRAAWAADSKLPLYGPDGFHPAPLGTWLAALVIYEGLTGHDARTLSPTVVVNGIPVEFPVSTVRLVQSAAHRTVERFREARATPH